MLMRETKIGMVVAGSFLSLVGGVLGMKLWREHATAEPTPEVAQNNAPAEKPPSATPVGAVPPAPIDATPPPPAAFAAVPADAPALQPPAVPATAAADLTPPAPVQSTPVVKSADPPPMPVFPAIAPPEQSPPAAPVQPPAETPKPVDTPTAPEPSAESPKPLDAPPPPPQTPVSETPKPIEAPKPSEAVKNDPPPVVATTPPAVPPPGEATLTTPPAAETKPTPAEPVARLEPPSRPAGGAPTPLPESVASGVQAAGVKPVAPPRPPVNDSFLEEEYRLQGGDTFAAVSRRFYFSEKYATALQQYNRDYPIAAPAMRQDPPRMAAGTVVWVPPVRIIERRYPGLVMDVAPLPGRATANAAPAWSATQGARPIPTGPGYKTYRVRDGGETMQDVARRALSNPQSWPEVYRLNPTLNPGAAVPIPAGTLLRLPAEAKTD